MITDKLGRVVLNEQDLIDLLYTNPDIDLTGIPMVGSTEHNSSVRELAADICQIEEFIDSDLPIDQFDKQLQTTWFMPENYKTMDIAAWILDQCQSQAELQRVGQELLLFQERNLFPLLCYLKYLVDTLRENHVIWGVGRGSSVASYVLYLIGVHRINSMYYDLDIREFLKDDHETSI